MKNGELHGDKTGAEALLDKAGWVKNADGKREKGGALLTLQLVAYPQRAGLPIIAPVIDKTLAALGITVTTVITSGDSWDPQGIISGKQWDMLLWAQHTLPAGDPAF